MNKSFLLIGIGCILFGVFLFMSGVMQQTCVNICSLPIPVTAKPEYCFEPMFGMIFILIGIATLWKGSNEVKK